MNRADFSDDFYFARREYCFAVFYETKASVVGCFDGMPMYYDRRDD